MRTINAILEGLHQDRVSESGEYKTIAGVHAKVDSDGKVINEDEWKTMHGAHILIDGDGDIIAGGPKHMRKKKDKKIINTVKKNAEKRTQKIPKHKMEGKIKDYKLGQDLGVDLDTMEDNVKLSKKDKEKVVKNIKDNVSALYDDELCIDYVNDADGIPGKSSYEVFMNALDKSKTVGDLRKLILNTEISRW